MAQVKNLEELRRTDPFADGANLDLAAYPWLTPQSQTTEKEQFGGLVNESRFSLRQALTDMAEKDGNDPEVARVLAEAGIENPSAPTIVHIAGQPFTIRYENYLWRGEGALNGARHRLSGKSRDELVGKFMALARKVKKESIRELTEGQLTEVARTAQRDRVQAINLYLGYAFPDNFAEENDAEEIVNNPRYADLLNEVCSYVWFNSRMDVSDSQDWRDFASEFCGERPISCALLDSAWKAFADSRSRMIFAVPPREEVPTAPEQLDDLSDDAVDKLMASTKREYVRTALAGRR
jgi:hypothetical protein